MKRLPRSLRTRLLQAALVLILLTLSVYWPRIEGQVLGDGTADVPPGEYLVTETHDGDTISVMMDGREERIRMIGIDTPETHAPNTPVQCYGREASRETEQLRGGSVRLQADPVGDNRDRYDRLLRYVYRDETLWNQHLIEQGYAFAYTHFPFSRKGEFVAAQNSARTERRGAWGACHPTDQNGRWRTEAI